MDQVQVEIVKTKLLESLLVGSLNILGAVSVVPKLASNEELLALDDGRDDFLESLSNFLLVLVDFGEIQVTVATLDGDLDSVGNLSGLESQVPRPIWGILLPSLRVRVLFSDIIARFALRCEWFVGVVCMYER